MSKSTLVIGDVHGHLDRLEALLQQEELLSDGGVRLRPEVEVVQLGDLAHYGHDTVGQDELTWSYAPPWLDVILWGNHDRALVDPKHVFGGYLKPAEATLSRVNQAEEEGRLKLAHEAHGFLLTHAGLHPLFMRETDLAKLSVGDFVQWLNDSDQSNTELFTDEFPGLRDAVSPLRGGWGTKAGGIIWRDAREPLYDGFRQVFGHTAQWDGACRTYEGPAGNSYCVDVGGRDNGRLMGMWLPEERVVEVALKGESYLADLV